MSKIGALLMTGVGGSGAALTAAYFAGAFGGNYDIDLPNSLNDFKQEEGDKVEGCVQNLFPGLADMKDAGLNDPNPVITDTAASSFFAEGKSISGCLVVNWEKYISGSNDNKWRGNFRFLWATKQEENNKGFIVFAEASTGTTSNQTDKKLTWKGIIYGIERNGATSPWEKKSKKEITTREVQESDLGTKFPKVGDALKKIEELKTKPLWGFLTESSNSVSLGELCDSNTCAKPSDSFKGYWELTDDKSTSIDSWTTGLNTWWEGLFGKDKWDMSKVVENQKGTWYNRKIVNDPHKTNATPSK